MIETAIVVLALVVGSLMAIVAAGYIYGRVTGFDEVESVNDAVAEAQERRND